MEPRCDSCGIELKDESKIVACEACHVAYCSSQCRLRETKCIEQDLQRAKNFLKQYFGMSNETMLMPRYKNRSYVPLPGPIKDEEIKHIPHAMHTKKEPQVIQMIDSWKEEMYKDIHNKTGGNKRAALRVYYMFLNRLDHIYYYYVDLLDIERVFLHQIDKRDYEEMTNLLETESIRLQREDKQ